MGEFFVKLFSNDFMPHSMCFLGDPVVLWLQVISDSLIALAYYAIPFLLFRFVRRRPDISFNWVFLAFAMFILACGTSHLLGALTVFDPIYRAEGVVKAVTAVASISTLLLLIPMMPVLIALPSPSALAAVNHRLELQIEERRGAEAAVRSLNEELEQRVAERTADLQRAVADLQDEMKRRQDLEKQLIQSQKMEAIGRLAGGVAHDFNNLLTVILGYSEMLQSRTNEQSTGLNCVREIQQSAERAAALTQQLLALSRRQPTTPRVVDLNEAVRSTEKMLRRVIGEDLELKLHLASDPARIKIDPSHVDQLLLNLAVNARDAMPGGGTLGIETANVYLDELYAAGHPEISPGPHVMIAVMDTGIGMDEATRTRIFEPFFTTKEPGKGTGLGLSIVYGIVKQNGGEILVYSEVDHGTVFKIYMPSAEAVSESPAIESVDVHKPPTGEIILLVEDDRQVRDLARAMLDQHGYEVLACASPEEALEAAEQHRGRIALLITDIVMPRMRGTELAALMRSTSPELRVLFMSGYTESGVLNQGMFIADMPFLRKPFTARDLRNKVQEAIDRASGRTKGQDR